MGGQQTVDVYYIQHIGQNFMQKYKNVEMCKQVVKMGKQHIHVNYLFCIIYVTMLTISQHTHLRR